MTRPGLLHYRFVSSRLRLSAVTDRKIQKQTALLQALKDRAIKEMRRFKLCCLLEKGMQHEEEIHSPQVNPGGLRPAFSSTIYRGPSGSRQREGG